MPEVMPKPSMLPASNGFLKYTPGFIGMYQHLFTILWISWRFWKQLKTFMFNRHWPIEHLRAHSMIAHWTHFHIAYLLIHPTFLWNQSLLSWNMNEFVKLHFLCEFWIRLVVCSFLVFRRLQVHANEFSVKFALSEQTAVIFSCGCCWCLLVESWSNFFT